LRTVLDAGIFIKIVAFFARCTHISIIFTRCTFWIAYLAFLSERILIHSLRAETQASLSMQEEVCPARETVSRGIGALQTFNITGFAFIIHIVCIFSFRTNSNTSMIF